MCANATKSSRIEWILIDLQHYDAQVDIRRDFES